MHMEQQQFGTHTNNKYSSQTNPMSIPGKYHDLTQSKMTSYSEFASWNHLDNAAPYW